METFATQRNPDVIRLKEGIDEMRRQLRRMEYGRATGNPKHEPGGAAGDFSVPLGSIPGTGVELARLIREAKIQETIFTLLTQQLEQAKIVEAKDMPTVRILDRAVVPEWKSRPKVLQNVLVAGVSSLFLAIFVAFFLEYLEGARKRAAHGS
jgi:capsule polysaccharide export protein KpsE/RkpR